MKLKVTWTNIFGESGSDIFETQNEADMWISKIKPRIGRDDRWLSETDGTHTDIRVVEDVTEYFFPKEYETETEDITAQENEKTRIENLIASGKEDKEKCNNAIALISGHNKANNLTTEQILAMLQTFAQIDLALSKGMPFTAKALISQVTVDGVIVTQQLKDDILGVL